MPLALLAGLAWGVPETPGTPETPARDPSSRPGDGMPPPGQGRSADLHHDAPPPHLGRGRRARPSSARARPGSSTIGWT